MIKKVAIAAALSLAGFSAFAEEAPGFTISPMAGLSVFDEELDSAKHLSLGLGYRFDNPWSLEFVYATSDTETDSTPSIDVDYSRIHLDALFNFAGTENTVPYVAFGAGKSDYDGGLRGDADETMINIGAGVKHFFAQNTALRGEVKVFKGFNEDEATAALSLGLHHVFASTSRPAPAPKPAPTPAPKAADSDGDGVLDNRDSCPTTARGVSVDSRGCALDSDKDGVPDNKDKCPNTTDRAATIDNDGCYIVLNKKVTVELKVEFDNNSAAARAEHKGEVKAVYDFMKTNPLTKVTIEGHTDSVGSAEYNKNLSQRRANTVANILINDFGVAASRVSAKGYGEEKPIASNGTASGRQQNRRVIGVVEADVKVMKKVK